ncbi:MAG: glycosyltransferase [Vicinamibacterales bacterium]
MPRGKPKGASIESNLIQLIPPLLTVAGLVPLALLGWLTPRTAAAAYVLASVPTTVWAAASVVRRNRPTLQRIGVRLNELLHFGARSYGVDLCGILALYVDQALVVGLLQPEAMGLYVVGLNLARVINAVQGSVALIAFPTMVGLAPNDVRTAIARSARLSALVSAAMGLVVIAAGGVLITTLYGQGFAPTARILPLFVAEVVLAGVAQVLLQGFMASNRPGVATLVQMSGLLLSVPIFVPLISFYGVTGAAVALVISTSIRLALTVAAYPLFLGLPIPRIWIGWSDVVDLAAYIGTVRELFPRFTQGRSHMSASSGSALRIFIAHPSALLTDHVSNGDGLVAFSLIRRLAERGHEIHVAAQRVDLREPPLPTLHIHVLPPRGDGMSAFDRVSFMVRMRVLFERLRGEKPFDIVHQMNPVFTGLSLSLVGVGTPLVLGAYVPKWDRSADDSADGPRRLSLRDLASAQIARVQQAQAAGLLIASPQALSRISAPERHRHRIYEVPHGIDLAHFVERSDVPDRPSILFLAAVSRKKGIVTLLESFDAVSRDVPLCELTIAGPDGGALDDVKAWVAMHPHARVTIAGPIERTRVHDLMRAHSVFCVPSYGEPFGMSNLEAMACGVPVVGTRAGGIPDLDHRRRRAPGATARCGRARGGAPRNPAVARSAARDGTGEPRPRRAGVRRRTHRRSSGRGVSGCAGAPFVTRSRATLSTASHGVGACAGRRSRRCGEMNDGLQPSPANRLCRVHRGAARGSRRRGGAPALSGGGAGARDASGRDQHT